jgi:hypothetical protein
MKKQTLEVNADGKTKIELGGKEREDKYWWTKNVEPVRLQEQICDLSETSGHI